MQSKVLEIWVEGKSELDFFQEFLESRYNIISIQKTNNKQLSLNLPDAEIVIHDTGGKDISKTTLEAILQRVKTNDEIGIVSLRIEDMDANFDERGSYWESNKGRYLESDTLFQYFLIPDNRKSSDGEKRYLENLLLDVIKEEYRFYISCWEEYTNCVCSNVEKEKLKSIFSTKNNYHRNKDIIRKVEQLKGRESIFDFESKSLHNLHLLFDQYLSQYKRDGKSNN